MDSDESTTSRSYLPIPCSHHSSPRNVFEDNDEEDLDIKARERRRILLEKLPSPREFEAPDEFPPMHERKLISISEVNPFFDELASVGSDYTTETEAELCPSQESLATEKPVEAKTSEESRHKAPNQSCKRTPSFRKIWSSLGSSNLPGLPAAASESQDSACSSSDSKADGEKDLSNMIKQRLKRVSNRVRKQISTTGSYISEKLNKTNAKSESSSEEAKSEGEKSFKAIPTPEQTLNSKENEASVASPPNRIGKTQVTKMELAMPNSALKQPSGDKLSKAEIDQTTVLWSIPNWVENHVAFDHDKFCFEAEMELEKDRVALASPFEWKESTEFLKHSVGKDFRRGYLAMGEKMKLANVESVKRLKFSQCHSFLAVGGEEGALRVLEMDYRKPLVQNVESSEETLVDLLYHVPIRSKCRIQMNESLEGHAYDLKCITWNNANGKLLTCDEAGVIIGWSVSEDGIWVEEMIHDMSTSEICDISWSPNGHKIAIGYKDVAQNGAMTSGVLVGLANGTHVFDRKFPNCPVHAVAWYDDSTVWTIVGFTLYSFDAKGVIGNHYRTIELKGAPTEFIEFMLRPQSSWISPENSPDFIVVYRESCVSLFNSLLDKSPSKIYTHLTITCADWSANGLYFVVGGYPVTESAYFCPQINLYNYEGTLLQILKVPDSQIDTISWTHCSLHVAFSSAKHIYFANLRPMYKISSSKGVHCYVHANNSSHQWLTFWNENNRMIFRENIPGKVIDIKSYNDKFSVLTMDSTGVYHIFIFGDSGVKQQHLCVITLEPFVLTMTKNSVMCLASNAVLNWNYNLFAGEGSKTRKLTGALKATRQVHIDDFPGIIVKPGEKQDHLQKPALDSARCFHAVRDRLCVARESGKLQIYALPTLGFLQSYTLDLEGDICQEIQFNKDGTQLALLTMNGNMRICRFPEARERRKDACCSGQQVQLLLCEGLATVTGMLWATDMSHYISVLEGNNLHFLHDDQVIETIPNVPSECYLVEYEGLHATLLCVESLIGNPDKPDLSMVLKIPSPTLIKIQNAIKEGECLDEIVSAVRSSPYSHPLLRKAIWNEALRQGDVKLVESIFTEDKNYEGLRFLEELGETEFELQRAHVHSFLMEYEQAQHYFIRAGRKDLAINMWKDLRDWEKVEFLSGTHSEETSKESWECQYATFREEEDWEMAFLTGMKLEDPEKCIDVCIASEDYNKLIEVAKTLPPKDPLLLQAGKMFSSHGLIEEAAYCFAEYGQPEMAMDLAVDTRHWDLAMKLSALHNLSLIQPALVKHVKSLIAADQLNSAVQILERCGKSITAAKLLIWKGLRLLEEPSADTLEVKKIFVLAANMLSQRKSKGNSKGNNLKTSGALEELDLEFLIPKEHLKIMAGHNEWCWSDPWRGAEAVHFLNLTQKFIYRRMLGRAFKAAIHLKKFEDIIGFERTNSLLALTGVNNGYLNVASNALLKLEALDEEYHEISFNLYMEHAPRDHDVCYVECPGCSQNIPDVCSTCPECNLQFMVCIYSASIIDGGKDIWTCQTCRRSVELAKRDRFEFCLLCHSSI